MNSQLNQHNKAQSSYFIDKIFLSPFFSGLFAFAAMVAYFILCYALRARLGVFDVEKIGLTETLTYLFYGL